ncbi:MAG: hypothetical protein ACOCXJ_01550, partial [Planctomycetota bacterium]
ASPQAPLFVYQTWPGGRPSLGDGGGDTADYLKRLDECIAHYDAITHILRQDFPDHPVYSVPCPQAMRAFIDKIEAGGGEWQGFTHAAELFDNAGGSVHISPMATYLMAMVHLATYYQRSPANAGLPDNIDVVWAFDLKAGTQNSGLSPEQARALQELAWEVVQEAAMSPVSRRPYQHADQQPPSAAQLSDPELLGPMQARLRWQPASDETELLGHAIYRNGDLVTTLSPDADTFLVSGLRPGEANELRVRAFDAAYNANDAVVSVTPPALGEMLLAWDLDPYSLRPEDVKSGEYRSGDEITVTVHNEGMRLPASIIRGPGLKTASRPFRGQVMLGDNTAADLAEAIAQEDYLSLTVAPASGSVDLGAWRMPVGAGGGVPMALLSSATGFSADQALWQMQLPSGGGEIAIPLAEIEALQGITEPVELRLYVWGGAPNVKLGTLNSFVDHEVVLYGTVR